MNPVETGDVVLDRAADLIARKGAWTQGTFARSAEGRPVHPKSPGATCWCAAGAIMHVAESLLAGNTALWGFAQQSAGGVTSYNDAPGRTQAEVVQMMRYAAKRLRGAS